MCFIDTTPAAGPRPRRQPRSTPTTSLILTVELVNAKDLIDNVLLPIVNFQGHAFREKTTDLFQTFHGNQAKEWSEHQATLDPCSDSIRVSFAVVLQYSQALDDTAALMSHSMGAAQIMVIFRI